MQEQAGRISLDEAKKKASPKPSIGRIVRYMLTDVDAFNLSYQRSGQHPSAGNPASMGDIFPMMITKVLGAEHDSQVNGQVFLDGNDVLWVKAITLGEGPGYFSWPERV